MLLFDLLLLGGFIFNFRLVFSRFLSNRSRLMFKGFVLYWLVFSRLMFSWFLLNFNGLLFCRFVLDRFVMNNLFVLGCLGLHLFMLVFGGFHLLALDLLLLLVINRSLLHRLDWLMLNRLVFRSFIFSGFMLRYLLVLNMFNLCWFLLSRSNLFFFLSDHFLMLALFMLFLFLLTRLSSVFSKGLFELFRNISNSSPIFRVFFLLSS